MSDFPEVKDHLVANPDRYTMTTNPDGTVTLRPTWVDNPSEVLQEGTPVDAAFLSKIPEAIDAIDTKVTSQLAETTMKLEAFVSVKNYGAKGDGINDDAPAIQAAIDAARVIYLPPGTYRINSSIVVPRGKNIIGASASFTVIKVYGSGVHGFILNDAYRTNFSDLGILCVGGIESLSAGFYFGGDANITECNFNNLRVDSFERGFDIGNGWWMNTVTNVRWITCDYSVLARRSTLGTSINNMFIHCYSDRPKKGGIILSAFKNSEIRNCNFGGRKGFDNIPTVAIALETVCRTITISGCNIEHHVARIGDRGIIDAFSARRCKIDTTNFFDIAASTEVGSGYAYYVKLAQSAGVTISDCTVIQHTDVRGILVQDDAELFHYNNDSQLSSSIYNYSSKPSASFPNLYTAPYKQGVATVTSGGFVSTGFARNPIPYVTEEFDGSGLPTVGVKVVETFASGQFQVRIFNLADGTENATASVRINWMAF